MCFLSAFVKNIMAGFENIIRFMIRMMYRRNNPYFKSRNCIAVITDKNIITRNDLYAYNFYVFVAFPVNGLNQFPGQLIHQKIRKRYLSIPLVSHIGVFTLCRFTLILRVISIQITPKSLNYLVQTYRKNWKYVFNNTEPVLIIQLWFFSKLCKFLFFIQRYTKTLADTLLAKTLISGYIKTFFSKLQKSSKMTNLI